MTSVRPENRPLLALAPTGNRHGSRSYLTCFFRCGNACDKPEPNPTDHPHIQGEIARSVARRSVLAGGAAGAGALLVAGGQAAAAPHPLGDAAGRPGRGRETTLAEAKFAPVPPNKRDAFVVPKGWDSDVVMRWGDRVEPGAPRFNAYRQSVSAARKQFGYNCDYVGLLPTSRGQALLVVNHEYTDEQLMFPADTYSDEEKMRIAIASHGLSVVRVKRGEIKGSWRPVNPGKAHENRRIHDATTFELTGPAVGDPRLRTSADRRGRWVSGTFNNCAGGMTPWGTVLSGEENFNQYFDAGEGLDARYTDQYARYGITGDGKGWSKVDRRFDLSKEPHEPNRFGWVVEVDPFDPASRPKKHTMLGRFKHEGANIAISKDGHAVAYMGDDERGDYLYKFVSAERFRRGKSRSAKRHNMELLTRGTLYVARLTGDGDDGVYDGKGTWLPLCTDRRSFVPGMSVADVLIFTRLAADKLKPTKMDRPEDVQPNPVNGKVYAALTNNSNRGAKFAVDEANPLASSQVRASIAAPLTTASGNRNGYVLEFAPQAGDHAHRRFTWNLFLVCGDPEASETWFGGFDKSKVSPISCPDNVAFDSVGNLWVSTDGNALGSNDGVFRVPVEGPRRGQVQQFCTVPKGAEACGPLVADRDRSLFVAVQHPGEIDGATFEEPASTWPHTDDFPRPSVVVAFRAR